MKLLDLDRVFDNDRTPARSVVPVNGPDDLPTEWHVAWDERSAILEYDGGLPREYAEAEALKMIFQEMHRAGE